MPCPLTVLCAGGLGRALAVASSTSPPIAANQQTALRLACNCFLHQQLTLWLQGQGSALLDAFAAAAASPNKNVRVGLATLLLNLAVLLGKIPAEELEFKAKVSVCECLCGCQCGVGARVGGSPQQLRG